MAAKAKKAAASCNAAKLPDDVRLHILLLGTMHLGQAHAQQIENLVNAKEFNSVWKVGRLQSGAILVVAERKSPWKFTDYKDKMTVYLGMPGQVQELVTKSADRLRDGGTTDISTTDGHDVFLPCSMDAPRNTQIPTFDGVRVPMYDC